ncbi:receptory region, transmembrane domain- and RING domain-containing protein 6-like [Salvia divinorum]|uniref:Receptory region, transmembrane domain- and RING domain-containing protein 6-like n=1 Tax=Salvia divinorum TaxID=28513 RepID=A0ABD1ICQ5_SALDI
MEENVQGHEVEPVRILRRTWMVDDYVRAAIGLPRLPTAASSVVEAVILEAARLGAAVPLADQLARVLPGDFGLLVRAWLSVRLGHSPPTALPRNEDGGGDDVLSQFKTRHYNSGDIDGEEETEDCCICLERLHRGLVATLQCRHEFHGGCIGRWLRRGQNFCPLCKARAIK